MENASYTHLSQGHLSAAIEEWIDVFEQRLNLLSDRLDPLVDLLLFLGIVGQVHGRIHVWHDLGHPGVDKVRNAGPLNRAEGVTIQAWEQMRRMGICQKLHDNGRLFDGLFVQVAV